MHTSATAIGAPIYDPEAPDLGPPRAAGDFDDLSIYVATALADGRNLFDVLADPFVAERADDYLSVLDHLAREPAVRGAIAIGRRATPATHEYPLEP